MISERDIAIVALAWLVGSFLLMARSIRRGRALADALALRHPAIYEALGRPRPGYFESARRTRFAQYVGRREFETLDDGWLCDELEAYRKSEARLVVSIIACGGVLAALVVVVRHVG
jgi:hypothetical protein